MGCNQNHAAKEITTDEFYSSTGGFGYNWFSLIKPYVVGKTGMPDWKMQLYSTSIDLNINDVKQVNVLDDLILIYSGPLISEI